jgi:hypothetical protein
LFVDGDGLEARIASLEYEFTLHQEVRDAERRLTGAPRTRWHPHTVSDWGDWGSDLPTPSTARLPDTPEANRVRLAYLNMLAGRAALRAAMLAWLACWLDSVAVELLAGLPAAPGAALTADHRPAGDLSPTVAAVRAHALLTAAPPASRVPIPCAGAAA